jgi:hypothetical protein
METLTNLSHCGGDACSFCKPADDLLSVLLVAMFPAGFCVTVSANASTADLVRWIRLMKSNGADRVFTESAENMAVSPGCAICGQPDHPAKDHAAIQAWAAEMSAAAEERAENADYHGAALRAACYERGVE